MIRCPSQRLANFIEASDRASDQAISFECVRSRDLPISDAFSHHRAVSVLHLANLCLQLGRKLTWDLATAQIVGDDVANAMQSREQRKGFEILA